ncbi:MAG: PBP1A family penicillin-binding protein [Helicobacteraceae bacterium]|jgi:penicillin-binding protein 1A|nr:PBP1A family penicillin-binding protein [Helicobacteraceae bacterium]
MIKFLRVGLFMFLIALIGFVITATIYFVRALSVKTDPLIYFKPQLTTQFYDRHGELIANIFGDEHRLYVDFDDIPSRLIEATVAIEDTSFFEHFGINPEAIMRAFYRVVAAGRAVEGASTITQQLVKIMLLSPEKTLDRKIVEAIISMRVELMLTKEQILERYLNTIPFGHGYYGVRTASNGYFRKELNELTLKEMALLAGLPRAPSFYDPTKHYQMAITRANLVIARMHNLGWISQSEYKDALAEMPQVYDDTLTRNKAPYVIDAIAATLKSSYPDLKTGGYTVKTTIDLTMQQAAEEALIAGYENNLKRLEEHYRAQTERYNKLLLSPAVDEKRLEETIKIEKNQGLFMRRADGENNLSRFVIDEEALGVKLSQLNGSLVTIHQKTGDLLVLIGGVDYKKSVFNRAFQAKRQVGSSFKPFIYLAAFDLGYSPASPIADISRTYKYSGGDEEVIWRPTNFENNYVGIMTARDAVVNSRNLATINLVDTIGISQLFNKLSSYLPKSLPYDMTVALGAHSLSPLEFAEYWTVISNYGERMKPRIVFEVIDRHGVSERYESNGTVVTKPEQAYLMIHVLQEAVQRGTGRRARLNEIDIAGKTGTTNDSRDAWFAGFTPDTETIIWFGNDDDSPMGTIATGGTFSAPIFGAYYKSLLKIRPELKRHFYRPEGITEVTFGNRKEIFTETSKQPRSVNQPSIGGSDLLF